MAGFFDRFLKKRVVKEEKQLFISEIPAYLDSKKAGIDEEIRSASDKARSAAISGIGEVTDKIQALDNLGENDIKHPSPKVRQTALKSKRGFLLSMEKTLSAYRDLPKDPDLLYSSLVELIRAVANNMRHRGKYLHPAFPDEMKDIKSSLDVIGRALNTMSEDLKPSVEVREKIGRAGKCFEKISSGASEIMDIGLKKQDLEEKREKLETSRTNLESERQEVISSGEFIEYKSLSKELESLEEKKDEISGRYGSFLVSCDNVLRKTAYIAERNGDKEISEKMNYLVVLLHSGEKQDSLKASDLYRELYPYISDTISENSSLIKNKNEEHLFSSAGLFNLQLKEICDAYSETLSELDSVKERISSLGIGEKIDLIDAKIRDIEDEMETIAQEIESGESAVENIEESVPEIMDDMTGVLSDIEEGDVVIEGDWRESHR